MKTIITFLSILSLASFSISCSSDEDNTTDPFTALEGRYRITVFELAIPMDLNNDGIASSDVFSELPEYFTHPVGDLELRRGQWDYKRVDFFLPHPNPAYEGEPFFRVSYSRCAFGVQCLGVDGTQLQLDNDGDSEYFEEWGNVQHMEVLPDGTITCTLFKKYYDFRTGEMTMTSVYLEYVRLPE